MNVIIHADCKIILKYHTCTHNLICLVRMKPQLKQTVFRVNGVNQMRQELPVLLVRVRHISTRTGCSGVLFQSPDILF